jgi:hypothetical protein
MTEPPRFDMDEIRAVIFQWLDQLVAKAENDARVGQYQDSRVERIAAVVPDLKLAADKSSYLGRRFYGDPHRTEACPIHGGRWSGLPGWRDCPMGCDFTGWLPRERVTGVDPANTGGGE